MAVGGGGGSGLQRLPRQAGRERPRRARRADAGRGGRGAVPPRDRLAAGSPRRVLQPRDGARAPGPVCRRRGAAPQLHGARPLAATGSERLGLVYLLQGRYEAAVPLLRVAFDPESADTRPSALSGPGPRRPGAGAAGAGTGRRGRNAPGARSAPSPPCRWKRPPCPAHRRVHEASWTPPSAPAPAGLPHNRRRVPSSTERGIPQLGRLGQLRGQSPLPWPRLAADQVDARRDAHGPLHPGDVAELRAQLHARRHEPVGLPRGEPDPARRQHHPRVSDRPPPACRGPGWRFPEWHARPVPS